MSTAADNALPGKVLVVGLPRTGTTSLCRELLELNYQVAHTAYSQASWQAATAVADTPAYSDFSELHPIWQPDAWLYLHRPEHQWLPSIRFLINQLQQQKARQRHSLPPLFWRSWGRVFGDFNPGISDQQLRDCYQRHADRVRQQATALNAPLHRIQLLDSSPHARPLSLVLVSEPIDQCQLAAVNHLLNNRRVTAWHNLKHPNKVSSHLRGTNGRKYFDYQPDL